MKSNSLPAGSEPGRSENKCPVCGKTLSDWPEKVYVEAGVRYCCQGCAEGSGCTCVE